MTTKKFEPVYYRKESAEKSIGWYNGKSIKKVKGNFKFRSNGKNIKRKTGWKIVGGRL